MPIDSQCTGCGKMLRVADEYAGRRARCPVCQTIYTVPSGNDTEEWAPAAVVDSVPPASYESSSQQGWYLRIHDGTVYGPVERAEMNRWVAEGRVDARCRIRNEFEPNWLAADHYFPILSERPGAAAFATPRLSPMAAANMSVPDRGPRTTRDDSSSYLPHRGVLILILAVLSWVTAFPVFGALAWYLGSQDLHEIRAGQRDPDGESLTRAGQVLGMLHVLLIAALLAGGFLLLLFAILGAFSLSL